MDINAAFKLFDVRGLYPQIVDERLAFIIGKALGQLRNPKKVLVASDTRESSPTLKNFIIDGLTQKMDKIFDLYEVPIPEFYFIAAQGGYDLGIMVTASHVSEEENGFKFVGPGGQPFDQGELLKLKDLVTKMTDEQIVVPRIEATRLNTTDKYVETLLAKSGVAAIKPKITLDVTKSSVVTTALVIFGKLKASYQLVQADHAGNPLLPENRQALAKMVVKTQSELGITWDADGDRVIFVDGSGTMIPPSFVLGVLGAASVRGGQGKKVVTDVRAGLVVRDLVSQAGGQIQIVPAWSQYIKFAMRDDPEISFGGENSGHIIFRDFFAIDDGLFAALRFLKVWQEEDIKSQLAEMHKKYFELPEKNIPSQPDRSVAILEKLANLYRQTDYLVSVADGLTVFGPNFKFNLRQSVTEPFLRLNLETTNEKTAYEIVAQIEKQIGLV